MTNYTAHQIVDRTTRIHGVLLELCPEADQHEMFEVAGRLAPLDLDAFDDLWQRRKADYPDHLSHIEGRIIGKILDTWQTLDGISCQVRDEAGYDSTLKTFDRATVEKEIAATCMTGLNFFDRNGKYQGWVLLVHGNQEDVVSDYTDNAWTEALVADANALAEALE